MAEKDKLKTNRSVILKRISLLIIITFVPLVALWILNAETTKHSTHEIQYSLLIEKAIEDNIHNNNELNLINSKLR